MSIPGGQMETGRPLHVPCPLLVVPHQWTKLDTGNQLLYNLQTTVNGNVIIIIITITTTVTIYYYYYYNYNCYNY